MLYNCTIRAVRINLFMARVLCRSSYRVLEYSTITATYVIVKDYAVGKGTRRTTGDGRAHMLAGS